MRFSAFLLVLCLLTITNTQIKVQIESADPTKTGWYWVPESSGPNDAIMMTHKASSGIAEYRFDFYIETSLWDSNYIKLINTDGQTIKRETTGAAGTLLRQTPTLAPTDQELAAMLLHGGLDGNPDHVSFKSSRDAGIANYYFKHDPQPPTTFDYSFFRATLDYTTPQPTTEKAAASFILHYYTDTPTLQTQIPTRMPTQIPTVIPTKLTQIPTVLTQQPTLNTQIPTKIPTQIPTVNPTKSTSIPTVLPTINPTIMPTLLTKHPTTVPSVIPTVIPTTSPTMEPTVIPSKNPSKQPSKIPTLSPVQICSVLIVKTLNKTINNVINIDVCNNNDNIKCGQWEGIYVDEYKQVNGKILFAGVNGIELKYSNNVWNLGRFLSINNNLDFPPAIGWWTYNDDTTIKYRISITCTTPFPTKNPTISKEDNSFFNQLLNTNSPLFIVMIVLIALIIIIIISFCVWYCLKKRKKQQMRNLFGKTMSNVATEVELNNQNNPSQQSIDVTQINLNSQSEVIKTKDTDNNIDHRRGTSEGIDKNNVALVDEGDNAGGVVNVQIGQSQANLDIIPANPNNITPITPNDNDYAIEHSSSNSDEDDDDVYKQPTDITSNATQGDNNTAK